MIRLLTVVFVALLAAVVYFRVVDPPEKDPVSDPAPEVPGPTREEPPTAPVSKLEAGSLSRGLPTKGAWRGKPVLADLDGDGRLDLVASIRRWDRKTPGEGIHVWLQKKPGEWTPANEGLRRDMGYGGAEVGDINGDGRLDIAFSGHDVSPHVFFNGPDDAWAGGKGLGIEQMCADMAVGDLDGDGHLDVAAVGQFPKKGGLHVFRGDGAGGFLPLDDPLTLRHFGAQVDMVDLDGDRRPELIAVTDTGPRVWTWKDGALLDSGQGLKPPGIGGSELAIAAADFDRDGQAELVVAGMPFEGHEPLTVYRREEETWKPWGMGLPKDEAYYDVAVARLEPSGPLTIVAAGKHGISLIAMVAPGRFERTGRISGSKGVFNVCLGDVTGDKTLEVVYVGFDGVRIYDLSKSLVKGSVR